MTDETELAKALEPFAAIGQWLFARADIPDSEIVATLSGVNGFRGSLTRGHFKSAHSAVAAWNRRASTSPISDETVMAALAAFDPALWDQYVNLGERFSAMRAALEAALSSQPAPQSDAASYWLIERRVQPPQWATTPDPTGIGAFFSDVHRAHRFPTAEAAGEAMRRMSITPKERGEFFVSEHIWMAAQNVSDPFFASQPAPVTVEIEGSDILCVEPSRTNPPMAWQPMETAPRDGTRVLLFEDGGHYAGEWMAADEYWTSYCGQYVTVSPDPTHWMPLPDAPGTVRNGSSQKDIAMIASTSREQTHD